MQLTFSLDTWVPDNNPIFQSRVYTDRGDNSSMKEGFSQQILHLKFHDELELVTTILQ